MLEINLGQLATVLGILGALGGVAASVYKVLRRVERMEDTVRKHDKMAVVMLQGLFAVLDGLHQQGCNGEVTKAHSMLRECVTELMRGDED